MVDPHHNWMSLDEVSKYAEEDLEPVKKKVENQYEELSGLAEEATLILNGWDADTDQGLQLLHQIKDQNASKNKQSLIHLEIQLQIIACKERIRDSSVGRVLDL